MKKILCFLSIFALIASGCRLADTPEASPGAWDTVKSNLSAAVETVDSIPDDTKAAILEDAALVAGLFGGGLVVSPFLRSAAMYFRNRKKRKAGESTAAVAEEMQNELYPEISEAEEKKEV